MSMNGRKALPYVREWSEDPPGCPRENTRHFRMSVRPSQISGSGREAVPDIRE